MPIKFSCAKCQKAFTVADSAAGKQGRCSDCGHLNTIPSTPAATPSSPATYEVTSSVNGAVFGPADKRTLNQWIQEGRITPDCQIKRVGSKNWKPAKQLFPSLRNAPQNDAAQALQSAEVVDAPGADQFAKFKTETTGGELLAGSASTGANPYAAGSSMKRQVSVSGEVVPTSGDIGFIVGHAFEEYKKQWGVMVGGFFVSMLALVGFAFLLEALAAVAPAAEVVGAILNIFVSTYLSSGFLLLVLKVGRGEPATLKDSFSGGSRVLPLIGYSLLVMLLFLVPMALIGGLLFALTQAGGAAGAGVGMVFVFLLIFLLSLLVGLLLWPGYFLILDGKTTVFGAFPVAISIAKKNILQFIAVYIIAVIVAWIGLFLLLIGFLFTAPLAMLIVCCAYLNMSGQIRA